MIEWLGIEHLFELTGTEALLGFLTPLGVCLLFFVLQMIIPGRKVPGYMINPDTGEPRNYTLNGGIVFIIVIVLWASEITGMPRDWFYRSSLYAVLGGTVLSAVLTLWTVFSQPKNEGQHIGAAYWTGRVMELSFWNERFDFKMYTYVVGGAMMSINALSGAAFHYEYCLANGLTPNPGVFVFAGFFTFYIIDYFIFERVQLYTYDLIYEKVGFKVIWGDLVVYGWMFIMPLYGLAILPNPGFSDVASNFLIYGSIALFFVGWAISRGAALQKYSFKRWPERKFLGIFAPEYIDAGDRKILCSGLWGAARHFNYFGEFLWAISVALVFGYFSNLWAWTYFIFMTSLFIYRERLDNNYCAAKYGEEKWQEYRERVKYRMIPGIY